MIQEFDWNVILDEVSKRLGPQEFKAWLEPTRLVSLQDGKLHISAPTKFHCDWINDHFKDLLQKTISDLYSRPVEVVADESVPVVSSKLPLKAAPEVDLQSFDIKGFFSDQASDSDSLESLKEVAPPASPDRPSSQTPTLIKLGSNGVHSQNTFDNFVVGASNQFAHAACRAVAEFPASQYNPLFIYSSAGLGKTHLLHSIANFFLQSNPGAKICYISAEMFANELIESIRTQKTKEFRQKYRDSYDMLLMDDFQFLAGKVSTQEEFFHTFNSLHQSRRQIVVTSDKSPQDIPGLEERIRTRFECGLIADIQPPEIETRIAILRTKAENDDIFLPEDVALFLASNIKSNIRELEGVLIRLEAQASLNGVEISLDLARRELAGRIKDPVFTVSSDAILNAVARHFGVRVSDLKSKDRSRKFSVPRQIAMYLLRKYTQRSLPEIGLVLGGKDHSTVLYGINAITTVIETDSNVQKHVQDIQNML